MYDDLDTFSTLPTTSFDAPRRPRREDAPADPEAIARTFAPPTPRELQPPFPGGIRGATLARRGGL